MSPQGVIAGSSEILTISCRCSEIAELMSVKSKHGAGGEFAPDWKPKVCGSLAPRVLAETHRHRKPADAPPPEEAPPPEAPEVPISQASLESCS